MHPHRRTWGSCRHQFPSSAALPSSSGLAVLTLPVRSTAFLWAWEAVVSPSGFFGSSCLLCGERVPISRISVSSLCAGFDCEVPSLLLKMQRRLTLQLRGTAARFLPKQTAGSSPAWARKWHQSGAIRPLPGEGCLWEGQKKRPREGEQVGKERERRAAGPPRFWVRPQRRAPKTPAGGGAWESTREACGPRFCALPAKRLDYNGNPARAFIRKVHQGSNIIHHLLEGAPVGYSPEIY